MKKLICLLLLGAMLLTLLVGCGGTGDPIVPGGPDDPSGPNVPGGGTKTPIVGVEAAKLLLAEERLNAALLKKDGSIFDEGVQTMQELADRAIENLSVTISNAAEITNLSTFGTETIYPMVLPVRALNRYEAENIQLNKTGSMGEEKQDIGKMEVVGDTVVWSDFGEVSNSYEYFLNLTNNIVSSANIAADMIDFVKKNIRVVDKWVVLGQDQYYLRVEENEELLCRYDTYNTTLDICRRYRNTGGKDVYELYRKTDEYEERMTYIAGERYELSIDRQQYFVADHSKGYWETYVLGDGGTHYNTSYFIMKDDICFNAGYDPVTQSNNAVQIISADRQTDIVFIGDYGDILTAVLHLCAFDGVTNITAPKSEAGFGEGYAYVTGSENVQLNTQNGSVIMPGDQYQDGALRVNSIDVMAFAYGYGADVFLDIQHETYEGKLALLKAFLNEKGLRCRRDIDMVLNGIQRAFIDIDGIIHYYKWNGYLVKTEDGIRQAIAAEYARFDQMYGLYTALQGVERIDFDDVQEMELNIHFAPIVACDVVGAKLNGTSITVEQISLTIEDTTLFVEGEPYKVLLALEDHAGSLVHLEQTGMSATPAGAERFTVTANDISLTLPDLADGNYRVVAYIATADGIRSSQYTPVTFDVVEQLPAVLGAFEVSAVSGENGTLTVVYEEQVDVHTPLTSEDKLSYEAFVALVREEAFTYGTPSDAPVEVLVGEDYVPLTTEETEIADGSYRIAYTVANGEAEKSGYLYIQYACVAAVE